MAKSDLLRVQDVRDAYRLIGDCRDLGSDPALWFPRMLEGLCGIFGASTATGGEGWWARPHGHVQPVSAFQFGLQGRHYERFLEYLRTIGPGADPSYQRLQQLPGRLTTRTRRQLLSDTEWYRSVVFNDFLRPTNIDHFLVSLGQVSDSGAISGIHLDRATGDRDFSAREQRLLNFFHDELSRLIGRALVSATEPSSEKLSPRLRQTLACLLEGDSEKQVAARLGLSPATAHQYVTTLYRRFGVQSRAQLLAHVMRRRGRRQWEQLPPAGTPDPS
jgi:DNA-binding CsgD family transcriptional regulator